MLDYDISTDGLWYLYWWTMIPLLMDYDISTDGLWYLYLWAMIPLLMDYVCLRVVNLIFNNNYII
jgi:hypothetical protein